MTIKEMLSKVDAYNEVAEFIGGEKVELVMHMFDFGILIDTFPVKDMKSFSKEIRYQYVDCVAKEILYNDEYEFGVLVHSEPADKLGTKFDVDVKFRIRNVG